MDVLDERLLKITGILEKIDELKGELRLLTGIDQPPQEKRTYKKREKKEAAPGNGAALDSPSA